MTVSNEFIFWTDARSSDLYVHVRGSQDQGGRVWMDIKHPLAAVIAVDGYLQPDGMSFQLINLI